jgi:large subunit ribosomal protein L4
MPASTYTSSGSKSAAIVKLPAYIFGTEIKNHELLKNAYLAYLANGRQNLAKTLKRGEVRGGGKKPWRQKGTGRARFGSIRNPIWRGGGITFGPSGNENYTINLSAKSKNLALRQALTIAAKDNRVSIIEDIVIKDSKTSSLIKILEKIGALDKTLIAVAALSDGLKFASQNLSSIKVTTVKNLNTFDVLNCNNLVLTKEAIKAIEDRLGEKK